MAVGSPGFICLYSLICNIFSYCAGHISSSVPLFSWEHNVPQGQPPQVQLLTSQFIFFS